MLGEEGKETEGARGEGREYGEKRHDGTTQTKQITRDKVSASKI